MRTATLLHTICEATTIGGICFTVAVLPAILASRFFRNEERDPLPWIEWRELPRVDGPEHGEGL